MQMENDFCCQMQRRFGKKFSKFYGPNDTDDGNGPGPTIADGAERIEVQYVGVVPPFGTLTESGLRGVLELKKGS